LVSLLLQFSFCVCAADLSGALNPDLLSAEEHIIISPSAFITQNGSSNSAYIIQSSVITGNFSNILQNGHDNFSTVQQTGDLNFVNINQLGNNNFANSSQVGFLNSINLIQNLDGNTFSGIQVGNNNLFNATQNGDSIVFMRAIGNGNVFNANMPFGVNYQINIVGDNVKASTTGQK